MATGKSLFKTTVASRDIDVNGVASRNDASIATIRETKAGGYLDITSAYEDTEITANGASGNGMADSLMKNVSEIQPDKCQVCSSKVTCD